MDMMAQTWVEFARRGRMIDAIKTYREANGVSLGEAKVAVARWVAINMPPSPEFQRGCAVSDRVAERLDRFLFEFGRTAAYWIDVIPPNPSAVLCQQTIRYAKLSTEWDRLNLSVFVVMTGTSANTRREAVGEALGSGSQAVWVIDLDSETVTVHRPETPLESRLLHVGATLDGGDVLPGFSCPVADLFA